MTAVVMVAAFAVPMIASADTVTTSLNVSADIQTQIQALLTQIKALQEQIKALVASSTTAGGWTMGSSTPKWLPGSNGGACITLGRTLHQGDQGDDVKNLQTMLAQDSDSDFHGSATGFFGPLTAHAMMMFQMHNGIASSTDGSVGPMTRGFFERRCGKGEGMGQGMGMNGGPGVMQGAMVRGTISSNNTSSISITTDGGSVTVNISASTTIKVFASSSTPPTVGGITDLVVGKHVIAGGPKNSDGSIQAMTIAVGDNLPMPTPMMGGNGEHQGPMIPAGMMPTTKGPQYGPGMGGGPQNW